MDSIRPGRHGRSRYTPLPSPGPDSAAVERRWDVEEAAYVLFGAPPWRSFYEHGAWHVAFVRTAECAAWYAATFGGDDVAIFRAVRAGGPDSYVGVAFERMK